jgi:hypothetical protein
VAEVNIARLTPNGREAQEAYRQLTDIIEKPWHARFGMDTLGTFRELLERLAGEPLVRWLEPHPDGWRGHCNRANAVFASGDDILRGVSDQRNVSAKESFAPRLLDGKPCQSASRGSHFAECAEAEVMVQPGALKFPPADARQVAGHQSERNSSLAQALKQRRHTRTNLIPQIWNAGLVDVLRRIDNRRHLQRDRGVVDTARPHHLRQNVRIEHSMYGYSLGACFNARGLPDGIHQRLPVMRARTAHQRAIDVEQYQIHCGASASVRANP